MDLYNIAYNSLYLPFFEKRIKKRNMYEYFQKSLRSQWVSADELEALQLEELKRLLHHADLSCPYYRRVFREVGFTPKELTSLSEIRKLPLLTKRAITQEYDAILSSVHRDTVWRKATGGSTGQPLQFAYTGESYDWRVAVSKRGYSWAGAGPGARQAYIWGVQLGKTSRVKRLKEQLHHIVDRHCYFNCFQFDEEAMSQCLARLNRFRPQAVVGYTNPLYNLALFIGGNSKLNFTPRGVICAAEKVHPYQREVIERVFGAAVFNTYGSREFMLIASECEEHKGLHVSADNLLVEIVKDDGTHAREGEIGRIVVTDLHNYGMPFIRYEIGDLGIATSRECSCGRGLPLIADVIGRSLDVIRTPQGKIVPGEFFPHLIKDFPEVERFQVIQGKLDHLLVKLVPKGDFGDSVKESIAREIRDVVGPEMSIEFGIVPEIPLTATGKYRVAISELRSGSHD